MINSTDLVAKLLANENLMVTRTNSKTAYFDVKQRILNLPLWKNMTDNIEGMMVAHEVGHALYTSFDKWQSVNEDRILRGYVNVIEDARIEKLVKRKYPGTRKTFSLGYKELIDQDFFGLKDRDLNTLLPIDKINMYFKAGISCGIKFNKSEKEFVERAERVESMDDVIALAKDILEYTRQRHQQIEAEEGDVMSLSEDDSDEDEYDFDYDQDYDESPSESDDESDDESKEESKDNSTSDGAGDELEDDLESKTDSALKRKLEELADSSIEYRYYELIENDIIDVFVPFKQIIRETNNVDAILQEDPRNKEEFNKFMTESERVVSYLVKEFEMRKSATAYKRAKVAKSGSLNLNKLYAHKISDDIFKRVMTVPNGKNHGMIFLLDWSGSMGDVIIPTVKQVINLAMFCRRIQIPFEVYAFSGAYYSRCQNEITRHGVNVTNEMLRSDHSKLRLWSDDNLAMLNLFSSKMTNLEFNTLARRFTSYAFQYAHGYALGDTPLNEALLKMASFIPKYKKQNSIEKLTFITLTDGEGNNLMANTYVSNYTYSSGKHTKVKNFIRDSKNGKDYPITSDSGSTTEQLLRMLKDRYDVTTLGFYITQNKLRNLYAVISDHLGTQASGSQVYEMRKDFKEHGFYSLKGTGRDDLFIVPDTSTKIVDQELEIDGNASAAAIARKFGKMFNTKKHSRVLLDRFISYVA